jgi:ABC-type phosphate/phosphonate transport system ATPase subunit
VLAAYAVLTRISRMSEPQRAAFASLCTTILFLPHFRTSRLDTCLRRAAVRRADDLLVAAYVRAAFISGGQAQRVAKALRNRSASGTRCTSVDDYHMSLP